MKRKPIIAVIMGENTAAGGNLYEMSKHYFAALGRSGALPVGIPYLPQTVDHVVEEFDGFLSIGARIQFPENWYVEGDQSQYPASERLTTELLLMKGFLNRNKPVLGICNGMQMLGCLHGCRMTSNVHSSWPLSFNHDQGNQLHDVTIQANTKIAGIVQSEGFKVNSYHKEAIVELSNDVIASAHSADGVVEAIEIPSRSFAMGLQWHPELLDAEKHPGARIFDSFVKASSCQG